MPRIRKDGKQDRRAETAPLAPCKVLDPEQAFRAGLLAEAGNGRRIIEGGTQLTEHQAVQLSRLVGMPAEVFREQIAARFQAILDLLSARLYQDLDKLKPESLAINIGILTDKYLLLRGISTPTTINQTNIQINGLDRTHAMAQLSNTRPEPQKPPQAALSPPRDTQVWDIAQMPAKAKEMVLADASTEAADSVTSWNAGSNGSSPSPKQEQQPTSQPHQGEAETVTEVVGVEQAVPDAQ